jgi:hypothetical protein
MSRGNGMRGVRIREGTFEGQCAYCLEYLPLAPEFWPIVNTGLRRCKACLREYKALRQRGYVASRRALYNAGVRARLAFMDPADRELRNARNRAWKAANRERIAAYNRAYRERTRAA